MTDEPIDCGDPWCFACWLVRFEGIKNPPTGERTDGRVKGGPRELNPEGPLIINEDL